MLRPIVLVSAVVLLLHSTATTEGKCEIHEIPCDDGECVGRDSWCDGKETCEDGSDEAYCQQRVWWIGSPNKCNEKIHFRCKDNGFCWPLAARCDGIKDCKDASDEKKCDKNSEKKKDVKNADEEEKKNTKNSDEDTEEDKENSDEDTKEDKENFDEDEKDGTKKSDEEKSDESSQEDSKESSEENGSDKTTTTTKFTSTSTKSSDEYDDYEDPEVEAPIQTTTVKPIPSLTGDLSSTTDFSLKVSTDSPLKFRPLTTEKDYYAKKMEESVVKLTYSTQANVVSTSTYRPPPVRSSTQYPTRPYINQYTTNRKPAVPHTGPTRPYSPRPYRYIGALTSGQTPSPYRGRYPVHQPSNGYRNPYETPVSNYISSQPRTNHRQQYRNGANGRADWRNGAFRPPAVYGRQLRVPSRFYFQKNYNEIHGRRNYPSVRRGVDWILSIRNATGGWGKETPRALVALSLVNNSFLYGNYENDLMQKYFQVHLGVKLLRDEPVSLNRLAMFVNALIATCQDPRDFQGWDLTELIRNTMLKLYRASRPPVINPLVYLSLCLSDRNLTNYEVRHLMTYLAATRNDEASRDMTCLALEAFACHMQKESHNVAQHYSLQKMVWNATSRILQRMKEDGSFGSLYSTALAAQALMSVNDSVEWNPEPTFRFLKSHQQSNGSFGDFLATYHVLPALSGRSLVHLRNTECNPPRVDRELSAQEILQHPGPKFYIRYSLHLGSPMATGYTVQVLVPAGISFFDVMRVAAYENAHFKFSYEEVNGKINVYSISEIPNDPEEGLAWRLYVRSPSDNENVPSFQQLYTGDIREFQPTPDQHVIFWYHPTFSVISGA